MSLATDKMLGRIRALHASVGQERLMGLVMGAMLMAGAWMMVAFVPMTYPENHLWGQQNVRVEPSSDALFRMFNGFRSEIAKRSDRVPAGWELAVDIEVKRVPK